MKAPKLVAFALAAMVGVASFDAGSAKAAGEMQRLSLRLDWLPAGYQAPVFLAAEKGWFKEHGIDLTIADGNGSATTVQLVGAGQVDVGFAALSNMAFARGKGLRVISIAGLFRKGDTALLVPNESPIHSPKDLKGTTLLSTAGSLEQPFLDGFFGAGGLTRADVRLLNVDASSKIPTYARGKADGVFSSASYTLPLVAAERPSRAVLFSDSGLNLPGFGLFTTETALKEKGDALRKVASIIAGSYAYVLKGHEKEAIAAEMNQRQQARLNADLLLGQLQVSLPFLYTSATKDMPVGIQSAEDWAAAIKTMEEAKAIPEGSKPSDYFTNDYLDRKLMDATASGQ